MTKYLAIIIVITILIIFCGDTKWLWIVVLVIPIFTTEVTGGGPNYIILLGRTFVELLKGIKILPQESENEVDEQLKANLLDPDNDKEEENYNNFKLPTFPTDFPNNEDAEFFDDLQNESNKEDAAKQILMKLNKIQYQTLKLPKVIN